MKGNSGASLLDLVKKLAIGIIIGFIVFAMLFLKPMTEDDFDKNNTTNNSNNTINTTNNTNTACGIIIYRV